MPIYTYECDCGGLTELLRTVDHRRDPAECEVCGKDGATLVVTAVAFDNLGMGVDSGFPTAYDRWEKIQRSKNSGKQWDSANHRYGGEWEKQK